MIADISKANNNWIYQSNKLIEASYTLTVMEQRLVRVLASMIKKDDDNFKEYEFKTKDLIKILNVSNSSFYRDIDKITDLLMQRIIKIKDIDNKEFEKYHWVEVAKYKNGILKLKINKDLKPFYLSLDWYTKYQLKNIMQFKSTYSFRLYELLKQYESIGNRLITIDDLRLVLDIDKKQYPKYANLKQKVINVAVNEININTDLHIDYEELKEVRKVTGIKFYIKPNNLNKKLSSETISEVAVTTSSEPKQIQQSFDDIENIKKVQAIFHKHKVTNNEASCILKDADNNLDLIKQCYDYLLTKDKVENVVGYMRKLVKGFNEPQSNKKQSAWDYDGQRTYDFDELERKIFGWESN